MVPAGAFGIVVFFLFVAPGICYELLRGRTRLPREESTFVHISRVLLSGTFITAISLFLMAIVRLLSPTSLLDLPEFLMQPSVYIANHAVFVGWTLLVQLTLSALLAVVFSDLLTSRASKSKPIHQADAWHALGELAVVPGQYVRLSVHLKSGRDVIGNYVGASTELDPTKRELLLGAPFEARQTGSEEAQPLDEAWQRMVILGSEIESFSAAYVASSEPPPVAEVTFSSRARDWVRSYWSSWKVAVPAVLVLLVMCLAL